jgi:CheY-like chemotaxis protein
LYRWRLRVVVMGEEFMSDGPDAFVGAEPPLRILQIEDDPDIAAMYALGMEMQGFEVLRAADGLAGVQVASASGPDLVVIDVGLPFLDGLQVLARLRQDPRTARVPALLLTAFNPSDYRQRAAALGLAEVLGKSETTPRKLAEVIRRTVPVPRLHQHI